MTYSCQKFVCVHGHFYQPPRENAWLEAIEVQDGAAPFHDWNARINHECYAANGSSRILNKQNKIVRIVNNYSRMSFNFGPTLLAWMETAAPLSYRRVLDADRTSMERFGGHGSAMAQVYNHIILPLAPRQDRITQIRWGIADFEHRFGRKPEGMWLAETAVDLESLDLLAQHGIRFTILAPHQCARVRAISKEGDPEAPVWHSTPGASVDPTQPYLVHTAEDRSIAVFFYDGPASRAVAFEGLLNDGGNFARRLLSGFRDNGRPGQLVHIATDGESYGHHHRHGDMALAYALEWIENNSDARLTNYGEFLEKFPPAYEAEIEGNTSWSCSHGIERWRSDCGCSTGSCAGWNQKWRATLRAALDWLRDTIRPPWSTLATDIFNDVDAARDRYIRVICSRSGESIEEFLSLSMRLEPSLQEKTQALKLMELERHLQLMFTSCGWFFDDISGIETVQVMAYAARAIQLASELFADSVTSLEQEFIERLAVAESNVPEQGNGAQIYTRLIKSQELGLEQVAAHYAVISLFEPQPETGTLFCYDVRRKSCEILSSGRGRFAYGQAEICSQITLECESVDFAVLHLGDHNLSAAVRRTDRKKECSFGDFGEEIRDAVERSDLPEVMRVFIREFGSAGYSLNSLFRDEQRRILKILLDSTLAEMERTLRTIYEDHTSLLHYLSASGIPQPQVLAVAAEFSLNADLRQTLESDPFDPFRVRTLLKRARSERVRWETYVIPYVASQRMLRAMTGLMEHPDSMHLDFAIEVLDVLRELPFELDLWETQNKWQAMLHTLNFSNGENRLALSRFRELGSKLDIDVDYLTVD